MKHALLPFCALLLALLPVSLNGQVLHIHDDANQLGTVDVATGTVSTIGYLGADQMSDIAFDPFGDLWGISFYGLYRINTATAAVTYIGAHGITNGNALVFGTDGTLYAAGAGSQDLFSVSTSTGAATSLGGIGVSSAGDLAFNGGDLFLSTTTDQLFRIILSDLGSSSVVGPLGYNAVYGLATANNGVLYGVAGTEVFSVDPSTGAGTGLVDYSGQGMTVAYGTSFYTEAGAVQVPEPLSLLLLSTGMLGVGGIARRRRHSS